MAIDELLVPTTVRKLEEGHALHSGHAVVWTSGKPLFYLQMKITARCPDDEMTPDNWYDDAKFGRMFMRDDDSYSILFFSSKEHCGSAIGPALDAFAYWVEREGYPAWPIVRIEADAFLGRRL